MNKIYTEEQAVDKLISEGFGDLVYGYAESPKEFSDDEEMKGHFNEMFAHMENHMWSSQVVQIAMKVSMMDSSMLGNMNNILKD